MREYLMGLFFGCGFGVSATITAQKLVAAKVSRERAKAIREILEENT